MGEQEVQTSVENYIDLAVNKAVDGAATRFGLMVDEKIRAFALQCPRAANLDKDVKDLTNAVVGIRLWRAKVLGIVAAASFVGGLLGPVLMKKLFGA